MLPRRVTMEEEAVLARLAAEVEADLRYVGLPVLSTGDCWTGGNVGSSTFLVFYDPSEDESGGVFVRWALSDEVKNTIIFSPDLAAERAIPLGSVTLETMTDAVERILFEAGWVVDRTSIGVHESAIRIRRKAPTEH
ncbi:hypothetical protein [Kitasatospora sp. NPDC059599]|uniref:hypothetical protein n=1 Tax=Kitasatospora sp. NPDC059599 TaxID=3346880 RepID=UPI003674CB0D